MIRFSQVALASVILLAASGTVMTVLIVGSWGGLVETEYGRMLLVKLGVVVAVIGLAAWNRMRLLPRVRSQPTNALQWKELRRILSYEASLLITVVALSGVLGNTSPGRHHGSGPAASVHHPASHAT